MASGPARRSSASRWLGHPALGSAVAAFLLYLPGFHGGYLRDDHYLIERHPYLRAPDWLGSLLLGDFWAPVSGATGMWRPLVVLSYWSDGRLGGWSPLWFHVVNAAAYALAVSALAWLLAARGLPRGTVWAGALVFATMPAHAESVAWISGRTDVFCALFTALTLALDSRARAAGARWPGFLACAALALALLSKETAAPVVAVLAVLVWCDDSATGVRLGRGILWLVPYVAVTAAYLALHGVLAPDPGPLHVADAASRMALRRTGWALLPGYVAFLWPWFPHSPDRAAPRLAPDWRLETALGVAAIVAAVAVLAWLVRRRSRAAPALALFLFPLLPPLALASARGYGLFGERHVFVPSLGAAWLLSLGLAAWSRGRERQGRPGGRSLLAALAAAGLVVGGAVETLRSLGAYRSDEAMYGAMVTREPDNPIARIGLAGALTSRGRLDEAAAELNAAARLDSTSAELHLGRASIAARREDWNGVLAETGRAIAVDPDARGPRVLGALALLRLGRLDEAGRALTSLRAQSPGDPDAATVWGQYLVATGRFAEAVPVLEAAAPLLPEDSGLWDALGMAQARLGRAGEARAAFARAVELEPGYLEGWIRLAVACQLSGDPAGRAEALARAEALPGGRERVARMAAPAR